MVVETDSEWAGVRDEGRLMFAAAGGVLITRRPPLVNVCVRRLALLQHCIAAMRGEVDVCCGSVCDQCEIMYSACLT